MSTRYNIYDISDTRLLPSFADALRERIFRHLEAERSVIDADLLSIPGVHVDMTRLEAEPLGLEVMYQQQPESLVSEYRGIRQHGEWVIDRHPEWGEVFG